MRKSLFCLLLIAQMVMAQQAKTQNYKYGYNGMELIAQSKKGTVVVSTFNSKTQIRAEIAQKVYDLYLNNKIKSNTSITIEGADANVIGKCVIKKKDTLTTVNFYYEKVCWNSGLTEIYKKNMG